MRWGQQPSYVSLYSRIKPCSNNCHETMTKAGTRLISGLYKTILNHAQTIVMRWGQQPPDISLHGHFKPCSDHCHEITTTAASCLISRLYKTMLRPLSWGKDNSRLMFLYTVISNHAQTSRYMFMYTAIYNHTSAIVTRWWYQPAHVSLYGHIKPCSDNCHEITTTAAACLISGIYKIMLRPMSWREDNSRQMLRPLSLDEDNSRCMFDIRAM